MAVFSVVDMEALDNPGDLALPDSISDENKKNTGSTEYYDFFLDITSDVCPMTFVKTKLLIERMAGGQIVEVRLNDGEPLQNVPRSVREHGHEVLSLAPEEPGGHVFRLRIRKADSS
jgi:tRNA 2-thiouridine synthesizing protein A